MNIPEFIELIVLTRDAVGGHVSNFVTVLFAYLIMAYLVADKLSLSQLIGITILYSIYLVLPANATAQDIQMLGTLLQKFHETHPEEAAQYLPFGNTFPLPFILIAVGSWLLSVIYAMQRYREKGDKGA